LAYFNQNEKKENSEGRLSAEGSRGTPSPSPTAPDQQPSPTSGYSYAPESEFYAGVIYIWILLY